MLAGANISSIFAGRGITAARPSELSFFFFRFCLFLFFFSFPETLEIAPALAERCRTVRLYNFSS
jgi:hypothetical protein